MILIKFKNLGDWMRRCNTNTDKGKDAIQILVALSSMEIPLDELPYILQTLQLRDGWWLYFENGSVTIEMYEGIHFEIKDEQKVVAVLDNKFQIQSKRDGDFCNGCRFLFPNETVQDEIKKLTGKIVYNHCNLYKCRVDHEAVKMPHPQKIFPCSRCIQDGKTIYTRITK